MLKKASKLIAFVMMFQILFSLIAPITAYANDGYMIEPLIEVNTKTYKAEIVEDKPVWFGKHYERKYMNFRAFYEDACQSDFSADEFKTNPTLCNSLDDEFKVSESSGSEVAYTGYDFMLKLEGFKNRTELAINDEDVTTNNFGKINSVNPNDDTTDGLKILSFPAKHGSGASDATELEMERAITIGNNLTSNLNSILAYVNNGKRFDSVSELVNKSILIRPTSRNFTIVKGENNIKDFIILYGTLESYGGAPQAKNHTGGNFDAISTSFTADSFWKDGDYPNTDSKGNLLAYIIPISQSNLNYTNVNKANMDKSGIATFVWAMPKGYTKIQGIDGSLMFKNEDQEEFSYISEDQDVAWVTVHQLSTYANNVYKNFNHSMGTKDSVEEGGNILLQMIAGLMKTLVSTLRTVLGLSDASDLIFNKGVRGTSSYNYGSMPDSWWNVVLRYHLIFQSISWFVVIVGLIKTLIDLNVSTINPGKRLHAYKTIERFVVVGFLLVLMIPISQFLLNMNNSLVQIFASQADPNSAGPPVIGSLGGIILQFAYFGIIVFINFTYIMRSIIIALLIVSGPFFASSMAFSENGKQYFSSWTKELLANIFMQSIHAFSFAFLTNIVTTGGGLESIVIAYSIIPITELIRGLIFAGAGSAASTLGKHAAQKGATAVKGFVSETAASAAGGIQRRLDSGEAADQQGGAGTGSGAGGKNREHATATLANTINSKISGLQEASRAKINDKDSSPADIAAAKSQINRGNMQKAALGIAGGVAGTTSALADSAINEVSDNHDFGAIGGKMGGMASNAAAGVGKVAGGLKDKYAGTPAASGSSNDGSFGSMPTATNSDLKSRETARDPKTGLMVEKFSGAARGGASYMNSGKDLVESMPAQAIQKMATGNSQLAPFYKDVQKMVAMDKSSHEYQAMNDHYVGMGIQVQPGANGNANIVYDNKFMQSQGIQSMSATKDGKDFVARGMEGGNVVGVREGYTYGNKLNK